MKSASVKQKSLFGWSDTSASFEPPSPPSAMIASRLSSCSSIASSAAGSSDISDTMATEVSADTAVELFSTFQN